MASGITTLIEIRAANNTGLLYWVDSSSRKICEINQLWCWQTFCGFKSQQRQARNRCMQFLSMMSTWKDLHLSLYDSHNSNRLTTEFG